MDKAEVEISADTKGLTCNVNGINKKYGCKKITKECDDGYVPSKALSPKCFMKQYKSMFEYQTEIAGILGQEQSFYTCNLADILYKVQLWQEKLPDIQPFFAVKANPDPVLLKLYVLLGYSFDCASEGEIKMVLEAGGDPQNIVFAHTIKTFSGLKYASSVGVDLMTFDNEDELIKIHTHANFPNARLLLRIAPDTVECYYDLSEKFGCGMSEVKYLLGTAKRLNLNVIGVSFHVGSLCTDPQSFVSTIRNCRLVFDAAKELGYNFTILDLGGGFFGAEGREGVFEEVTQAIKEAVKNNFPDDVEVIAEPGCFCVASALSLTTAVLGKRVTNIPLEGSKDPIRRYYYVNDGIYGSFYKDFELYDIKPVPLVQASELQKRPIYNCKIFGRTCCSTDVITRNCAIPDMNTGESIVWTNVGAYSQAICSTFCGVPLPATYHVFMKNSRLKLELIPNFEEVASFLKKVAVYIENEKFDQEINNFNDHVENCFERSVT